jgi:hypothetical protein
LGQGHSRLAFDRFTQLWGPRSGEAEIEDADVGVVPRDWLKGVHYTQVVKSPETH